MSPLIGIALKAAGFGEYISLMDKASALFGSFRELLDFIEIDSIADWRSANPYKVAEVADDLPAELVSTLLTKFSPNMSRAIDLQGYNSVREWREANGISFDELVMAYKEYKQ